MKLYTYRGGTGWFSYTVAAPHADEARELIRAAAFADWIGNYVARRWPDREVYIARFAELWPDPHAFANLEVARFGEVVSHYNDE